MVGYFSGSALNLSFKELVINKGRQLVIPSIVIASVYLLDGWIFGEWDKGVYNFVNMPWFLKCTFLCFVLYYACNHLFKSKTIGILVGLLVSLAIGRFNFMWMYPCFLFGVLVNRNFKLLKSNAGVISLMSGVIFFAMLFFWGADFWIKRDKVEALSALPDFAPLFDWVYHYSFKNIIGLAATLFFISLFEFLSDKIPATALGRRVCGWGKETLGVYLLQTVIIEIIMVRWIKFDNVSEWMFSLVITPLISIFVLLICLWLIDLAKKSRWLSLLLLGLPLRDKQPNEKRQDDKSST